MRERTSEMKVSRLCGEVLPRLSLWLLIFAQSLVGPLNDSRADFDRIGGQSKQMLIATSPHHTCALTHTTNAGVRCWGANTTGQLGDGTLINRTSPVDVQGLSSGVAAVGVGDTFSCALLTNGQVKCWGSNSVGQIGNSLIVTTQVPVNVMTGPGGIPLTGAVALSVGRAHACVLLNSGGAKCWGGNNSGQLGNGSLGTTVIPTDVMGYSSGVRMIDAGGHHTCLVTSPDNHAFCFGSNSSGQLGNGTYVNSALPVAVTGVTNAVEVSAGLDFSCARRSTGAAICWGNNSEGTLGDGSAVGQPEPISVSVIGTDAKRISAGLDHTCATRASDGEVLCWGRGQEGQLGDSTSTLRTAPATANPTVKYAYDISTRGSHTCAWMGTCSAKCWGANTSGQLGNGTTNSAPSPVSIAFCSFVDPTPTPTPTPLPDACASETACAPDSRLTTPLDPKPPVISVAATTSDKAVKINLSPVKLGIPTDLGRRYLLVKKLSKFLKRKITNLTGAIRLLDVYFVVSVVKVPTISSNSLGALAAPPTKYKTETRKRRVTTRLAAGTYVARVTVRLRDAKGRTFVTGTTAGQRRFTVR